MLGEEDVGGFEFVEVVLVSVRLFVVFSDEYWVDVFFCVVCERIGVVEDDRMGGECVDVR